MKKINLFVFVFVTSIAATTFAQARPPIPGVTMVPPALLPTHSVPGRDVLDLSSVIVASMTPLAGTNVTFVENDTDFYMFDIFVTSKGGAMKKLIIMDMTGRVPEVGLPPHSRAWYKFCACGQKNGICLPVLPGTNVVSQCREEVYFKVANWEPTLVGTYMPTGLAGTGCKWRIMSPRSTSPEDNRMVLGDDRIGEGCQ